MSDRGRTIERIVPDRVALGEVTGQSTLELHVDRYELAATQAQPGRILDAESSLPPRIRRSPSQSQSVSTVTRRWTRTLDSPG